MESGARRRGWLALGVSLGVHACVLALAARALSSAPVEKKRPPIELTEVRWIEATKTEDTTKVDQGAGPVVAPKRVRAPVAAPVPVAKREAPPSVAEDSPRALTLTPSPDAIPMPSGAGPGDDAPRGRTLHPEDLPSDAELLADEHERVLARVDGWTRRELSAARVRGGLPDPAYGQLGVDLRAATDDVPKFIDTDSPKEVVGALLESWGAGAARYGKTGAPYAEPEGRLENVEKPSEMAKGAANGSPDAIATANFLAAGARLQEFADGRAGLELYALVEIKQRPSGALESVELIRPSGLRPFDAWVTDKARAVGVAFSRDAGTGTKALRSVWRFDGIITYRRKLKLSELNGRAAIGMVAMNVLSALSSLGNTAPQGPGEPTRPLGPRVPGLVGRFDEMTGEMDMVDLTNPTYDCKVTLLEAD
jgi:hypothetical protein